MTAKKKEPEHKQFTQVEFDRTMDAAKRDLNRIEDAVTDVREITIDSRDVAKMALGTANEAARIAEKSLRVAQATLTTVQSIDGRLKGMDDHGERIERLEDEVLAGNKRSGFRRRS